MVRRVLLPSALVAALASCAAPRAAAPAVVGVPEYPPPVAPSPPPPPKSAAVAANEPRGEAPPLEGTTWTGPDSDGTEWSFMYLPKGRLRYTLSGTTYDDRGTWKQEGDHVTMETNNHYADFTAHIHGDQMEGSAENTAGKSWTWTAV